MQESPVVGQQISLNTSRMQCIGAYLARPDGPPKGGIVVVQEIFGVNAHMRRVTDRFAERGYTAIAPAFFDHVETGVELGYDEAGYKRGQELVREISFELAIADVAMCEDVTIVALQPLQRIQIAGIGQLVEIDDRFLLQCKPVEHEIPANETGAARNQNRHLKPISTVPYQLRRLHSRQADLTTARKISPRGDLMKQRRYFPST